MHEMGVILHTVDTVTRLCNQYHVSKLGYVKLEVGELSSALPIYLRELWPAGTKNTVCEGTELLIEERKGIVHCKKCDKDYPAIENLVDNFPVCPYCGCDQYSITEGADIAVIELGIA